MNTLYHYWHPRNTVNLNKRKWSIKNLDEQTLQMMALSLEKTDRPTERNSSRWHGDVQGCAQWLLLGYLGRKTYSVHKFS